MKSQMTHSERKTRSAPSRRRETKPRPPASSSRESVKNVADLYQKCKNVIHNVQNYVEFCLESRPTTIPTSAASPIKMPFSSEVLSSNPATLCLGLSLTFASLYPSFSFVSSTVSMISVGVVN